MPDVRIEYMPLSKLVRAPRNPKEHHVQAIAESVDRFGYVSPLVMNDATGRLVAGHGRLDALQAMKAQGRRPPERIRVQDSEWLVPVVRGVEFKDEREAEAYLLADNRTTELGGWDEERLTQILADLNAAGTLDGTGYDGDDLDVLLQWQAVPELDELAKTYGEPQERDFWPFIRVQVSPETMETYLSFCQRTGEDDETEQMTRILMAVDADLLGN